MTGSSSQRAAGCKPKKRRHAHQFRVNIAANSAYSGTESDLDELFTLLDQNLLTEELRQWNNPVPVYRYNQSGRTDMLTFVFARNRGETRTD
jgi:hypothetical protein